MLCPTIWRKGVKTAGEEETWECSIKANLGREGHEDEVVIISKEKNGIINGQEIAVRWENHRCGRFPK